MSVPRIIDDGNWDLLTPMSVSYGFPFAEKNDNTSFELFATYRQDKDAYRRRALMSLAQSPFGSCYLVKPGDPRDIGLNLFEFEDTFASLPVKRIEYGSFPFTIQWWRAVIGGNAPPGKYFYDVNYDIEEQTFTVGAQIEYEYFLNEAPKPLIKTRVFLLYGFLQIIGTPQQGKMIAEDSQVTIYKAAIYERRTIYVNVKGAGRV